jgi:predicted metal-dependent peptidase
MKEINIRKMIADIFKSGDFLLGSILSTTSKIETESIPTAAVGLRPDKRSLALYYNTEFFASLKYAERLDVLRHEAMHIAQCHLTRINGRSPKRWNVACDMTINQYLDNLPESCILPEPDFPKKASADNYYELIEDESDYSEDGGADSHEMWEEVSDDPALSRKIESETGEKVRNAAQAGDKTARALLEIFAGKPSRRWVSDIRRMFNPSKMEVAYKSNRFDRRRTYPNGDEMIPARVSRPERPVVFVAIDTSASITDDQIAQFVSEIDEMAKTAEITALVFDTEIHSETPWKRLGSNKFSAIGRGGTNFQPVFDRVCEESVDRNLIVLTDGYADEPKPPKSVRVLWALTKGSSTDFNFKGAKTRMDV